MKLNLSIILLMAVFFTKCSPEPIPITIKEAPPKIAISSTAIDENTAMVIASYSISSFANLNFPTNGTTTPSLPQGILIDNAVVTISNGTMVYTLDKVFPGVYVNSNIHLTAGMEYNLSVKDPLEGKQITAKTTYNAAVTADKLVPVVTRNPNDTIIQLKMRLLDNSATTNYYVMAYDHINPKKVPSPVNSANFSIIDMDGAKKVEVFSSAEAVNGIIDKTFSIVSIKPTDTLFVHYGKIDKGYFNYLKSYKKTGSLINQITAEPITLPTNIITGYGYFALYNVKREFFFLKDY